MLHHDRLKLCNDRLIPFWLRRKRHTLLDLDSTIAYDEEEQGLDVSQDPDTKAATRNKPAGPDQVTTAVMEPDRSTPIEQNKTQPFVDDNPEIDRALGQDPPDFAPLITSSQLPTNSQTQDLPDVGTILQNKGSTVDSSCDDAQIEDLLEGGVLDKMFKLIKKKPSKPVVLGLAPKDPSSRGRRIKPPSHLQNFVC